MRKGWKMGDGKWIPLSFLFGALFFTQAFSQDLQDTTALHYSKLIKEDDLKQYLEVLTADSLEGRETGKEGQRKAARFIASHFASIGLTPPNQGLYFQDIALNAKAIAGRNLQINAFDLVYMKDYYYQPGYNDTSLIINSIQFAGYGIEDENYNDYDNINGEPACLMFFEGEPVNKNGESYITETNNLSDWSSDWNKKENAFTKRSPSLVFVITSQLGKVVDSYNYMGRTSLDVVANANPSLPTVIYISYDALKKYLLPGQVEDIETAKRKIDKKGKPRSFMMNVNVGARILSNTNSLKGENVLGYIEGTDLKNEVLVISAHNDHLGKKDSLIYHGADDDGSGTSAVMELAKTFAIAKKEGHGPRRSILFLSVGGEEKGLLGSTWYTDHPVFPLESTITDLNIDMIGRIDTAHTNKGNYIYIIGSDKLSTTLHKINEENNTTYTHLALDYLYNRPDDANRFYYRSDHYNFAKHKIPVIFYFNGVHADYHRPTDTIDKINFFMMMWRTKLVFFTAWQLTNMDKRPAVDVKNDFEKE